MKKLFLGSAVVVALTAWGGARAAELPATPIYKVPPVVAPIPYNNWSGFYIGINGGGAWGRGEGDPSGARADVSGGFVGGTAGYNLQAGRLIFGIEGDFDWANIHGSVPPNPLSDDVPLGVNVKSDRVSTVRGRIGYAFDRFLPYITGGAAFLGLKMDNPAFLTSARVNLAGLAIGAGIEVAITGPLSLKLEYLHLDLGRFRCPLATCDPDFAGDTDVTSVDTIHVRTDTVRVGLNYRFAVGEAPVTAKY